MEKRIPKIGDKIRIIGPHNYDVGWITPLDQFIGKEDVVTLAEFQKSENRYAIQCKHLSGSLNYRCGQYEFVEEQETNLFKFC